MSTSGLRQGLPEIAIVGMAGRFPGARNIEEFWQNLLAGTESISFLGEEDALSANVPQALVANPAYIRARGVLEGIEMFDAAFFGFTPREAELTDPQHRLFLECAHEALEDAACDPSTYEGAIGVYAGMSMSGYMFHIYSNPSQIVAMSGQLIEMGNDKDYLPTRVSYKLDLHGPSISVNSACSTSLVSVCLACQSLLNFQSDMALAGGVSITVPQNVGYLYQEGGINSPDGHCRPFDAHARGTVGGNGVGVVVLKRLTDAVKDGNRIYAVIKGAAINNDGALKVGYTAPSIEGQAKVIALAQAQAAVSADTIDYIEAHGTGTSMGDPIEIAALSRAFRASTSKKQFCALGALKANIGHLDAASGVAGLIKTVLALHHGSIPPQIHFREANPKIDLGNSPFFVNTELRPWKTTGRPRRAGVSSFGIGGTNAHVVLEEAPAVRPSGTQDEYKLLVMSAKTPTALHCITQNLVHHLEQHAEPDLADVAYTLHVGRKAHFYRRMIVCRDTAGAIKSLNRHLERTVAGDRLELGYRPITWLFTGQGTQYVNMGRKLYQHQPAFRAQIDQCAEMLHPWLGKDLRSLLYPQKSAAADAAKWLGQTAFAQPALFAIEYALAQLWREWGFEPGAMIGHSVGEYVAACIAGVMDLKSALKLVAARGRLMQSMPEGAMMAVELGEQEIMANLPKALSLAAVNSPRWTVVSGATADLYELEKQLAGHRVTCRRLHTSHAFHSAAMDPILAEFGREVAQVSLKAPTKPYISNVTGKWITREEATSAEYWVRHLRGTVRFAKGVQELLRDTSRIYVEIGPGSTLVSLLRQSAGAVPCTATSSLPGAQDTKTDTECMLEAMGLLWLSGLKVDWRRFHQHELRRRISLPTYPFERSRHWIQSKASSSPKKPARGSEPTTRETQRLEVQEFGSPLPSPPEAESIESVVVDVWREVLGVEDIDYKDDFFALGGYSVAAIQMVTRLRELLSVDLHLTSIFEDPTVLGIAQRIRAVKKDGNQGPLILIPIQSVRPGSGTPLFCVHPIGGGAFSFIQLARHLGAEQPVYALQGAELADVAAGADRYSCLEEIAKHYLEAVATVQDKGPYLLSGLSWGGIVAFEMAQQLRARGEDVDLLALLDTPSPSNVAKVNKLTDTEILVSLARDLATQRSIDLPLTVDDLDRLAVEGQFRYVLQLLVQAKILTADVTPKWLKRHLAGYRARIRYVHDYSPQPYPGKITLFRAASQDKVTVKQEQRVGLQMENRTYDWDCLSTQPVTVLTIPGTHSGITVEPNVQMLAASLREQIWASSAVPALP